MTRRAIKRLTWTACSENFKLFERSQRREATRLRPPRPSGPSSACPNLKRQVFYGAAGIGASNRAFYGAGDGAAQRAFEQCDERTSIRVGPANACAMLAHAAGAPSDCAGTMKLVAPARAACARAESTKRFKYALAIAATR